MDTDFDAVSIYRSTSLQHSPREYKKWVGITHSPQLSRMESSEAQTLGLLPGAKQSGTQHEAVSVIKPSPSLNDGTQLSLFHW